MVVSGHDDGPRPTEASTMRPSWLLPRRTFLRAAGACIALPLLDAMSAAEPGSRRAGKPPVRLGWFYVPNGVVMDKWKPATTGTTFELPPILKPLEPVRKRVLVLSDLAADHCVGVVASHEPSTGGILTGLKCKHSEEPEAGGVSIDQLAAKRIGDQTPVDALTLGIDPGFRGDHGYSGTYLSHMSWRSASTPAAVELNPKELFDRLFGGRSVRAPSWDKAPRPKAAPEARRSADERIGASVLDLVRDDARRLLGDLGANDRAKMEGYLEGIRGLERRLDLVERDQAERAGEARPGEAKAGAPGASLPPELMIPTRPGIPSVYADHVDLMLDILTLAFWTDTTHVGTFLFSVEKSGRAYPEIGAPGSHHSTSHHANKPENLEQLLKINTHHMSLFARMLGNMAKLKEGDGTLLDNVALMYGCGIGDGNRHNHDDLPILLAGGAGGALPSGAHVAFGKKTPVCNLYLDMMASAGLELPQFGDSTGHLTLR
jgi:hypothetical protein